MQKQLSDFVKSWEKIIEDVKTRSYDKKYCRVLHRRFNIGVNELMLFKKMKGDGDFLQVQKLRGELEHAIVTSLSNYDKEKRSLWGKFLDFLRIMASKIPTK